LSVVASGGLGGLFLAGGCGDESRTTGTQLQMSDEAKAQIKDMRDMYKQEKGSKKDEARPGRGRRQ
jgi:hypothetical protein